MRLAGKRAFVTGGRQGIGRGIVDAFQAEGAAVATCGRGARPKGLDDSVTWYELDVSDAKAVEAIADATDSTDILGPVDNHRAAIIVAQRYQLAA